MSLRAVAVVLVAGLVAASCGGASEKPAPAQSPAAPAAAAATGAGAEFGVAECDDYIRKYLACIDSKVPEAGRTAARQSLEQVKAQWKAAASTPDGKSALATGCKAATDAARTSMAAYGCTF